MKLENGSEGCLREFEALIARAGFTISSLIARARGIMRVYVACDKLFLLADEEGQLHADLVFRKNRFTWCRASLNQAIWFKGDTSLKDASNCDAQLEELCGKVKALPELLVDFNISYYDNRSLYEMNKVELIIFTTAMGIPNSVLDAAF